MLCVNRRNTKDKLYKKLIQTNIENEHLYNALKEEFRVYRATLRKSIREAKRLYYVRTFNIYKNDIKKTWLLINETINRKLKKHNISEFIIDNRKISDPNEIANQFNEYFINIGNTLSEQIQPAHYFGDFFK